MTKPSLDDPLHDREIGARDSTLDTTRIDDVRIGAVRPLITPALLQERVPVRDDTLSLVEASRADAHVVDAGGVERAVARADFAVVQRVVESIHGHFIPPAAPGRAARHCRGCTGISRSPRR